MLDSLRSNVTKFPRFPISSGNCCNSSVYLRLSVFRFPSCPMDDGRDEMLDSLRSNSTKHPRPPMDGGRDEMLDSLSFNVTKLFRFPISSGKCCNFSVYLRLSVSRFLSCPMEDGRDEKFERVFFTFTLNPKQRTPRKTQR